MFKRSHKFKAVLRLVTAESYSVAWLVNFNPIPFSAELFFAYVICIPRENFW